MVYMYTLLEFLRNERFYINGKSTPVDRTWGGGVLFGGKWTFTTWERIHPVSHGPAHCSFYAKKRFLAYHFNTLYCVVLNLYLIIFFYSIDHLFYFFEKVDPCRLEGGWWRGVRYSPPPRLWAWSQHQPPIYMLNLSVSYFFLDRYLKVPPEQLVGMCPSIWQMEGHSMRPSTK